MSCKVAAACRWRLQWKPFPQNVHRESMNFSIKGRTFDWKKFFTDEAIKRQKHTALFTINVASGTGNGRKRVKLIYFKFLRSQYVRCLVVGNRSEASWIIIILWRAMRKPIRSLRIFTVIQAALSTNLIEIKMKKVFWKNLKALTANWSITNFHLSCPLQSVSS